MTRPPPPVPAPPAATHERAGRGVTEKFTIVNFSVQADVWEGGANSRRFWGRYTACFRRTVRAAGSG